MKKLVVIGFLGSNLDSGKGPQRLEKWRPTVSLARFPDLRVGRLELLYETRFLDIAETVIRDIADYSPDTEVRLNPVGFNDPWDFEEVYGTLHDFARGYEFDPEVEDYLIHITTGTHVAQICMFLLTESRRFPARLLQTAPPRRSDRESPGGYALIDLDLSKYDRLASRFRQEQLEGLTFLKSGIDTRNVRFNRMIERIEQVAVVSPAPILLMGPTGAGKSHLAKRIFELKKARRLVQGRFVEVNCATLRGDTAMSTLFGHTKGAFTGAMQDRPGLLRSADGGLLFLDEIGELGLDEQAMLLRALEEKTFMPMGSDREASSDFLLIAGTNRELATAVRAGRFRDDLLARINLWTFQLPGLGERKEDIEPNLDFELEKFASRTGNRVTISREARARFLKFAALPEAVWSGNFRDLNAAVIRMATLAPGGRISVEVVEEEIERLRTAWGQATPSAENGMSQSPLEPGQLAETDLFDRLQLEAVVAVCRRNRTLAEAGRELFAVSRTKKSAVNDSDRLKKYLARFGLTWRDVVDSNRAREESAGG